ncbi:MAG: hypothetical protein J6C86_10845 [Bacteroidaceae bacterium]|nr:hypothetical protein [Bacteroidaceae bacterium]
MKAYVTLLSNERYLKGVLALNQSLIENSCQYPLYCMLSKDADKSLEDSLDKYGIKYIRFMSDTLNSEATNEGRLFYTHWSFTFDKLHVWGLTQFEKIVFLDSDMIVLDNLDNLFDAPPFSAVVSGGKYCGWTTFNSGLMVVKPDKQVETDLVKLAPEVIKKFRDKEQNVGDQDVLHAYLLDWEYDSSLALDEGYNIFADFLHHYIRRFGYSWRQGKNKKIRVIHFIGHTKPWTRKSLREKLWICKISLTNPYYALAYIKFFGFLKRALGKA